MNNKNVGKNKIKSKEVSKKNDKIKKDNMTSEEYILYKLSKLSKVNKHISKNMVKQLGYLITPQEAAEYLGKCVSTIYEKIKNKEILAKKMGNKYKICTETLILLLEEID